MLKCVAVWHHISCYLELRDIPFEVVKLIDAGQRTIFLNLHGQGKHVVVLSFFGMHSSVSGHHLLSLLVAPFRFHLIFFIDSVLIEALLAASKLEFLSSIFLFFPKLLFLLEHGNSFIAVVMAHLCTKICHQLSGSCPLTFVLISLCLGLCNDYFWLRFSRRDINIELFWVVVLIAFVVSVNLLLFEPLGVFLESFADFLFFDRDIGECVCTACDCQTWVVAHAFVEEVVSARFEVFHGLYAAELGIFKIIGLNVEDGIEVIVEEGALVLLYDGHEVCKLVDSL